MVKNDVPKKNENVKFNKEVTHFLFGVSAKHFSDDVSTTVSQNATTGSATLISVQCTRYEHFSTTAFAGNFTRKKPPPFLHFSSQVTLGKKPVI